MATPSSWPSARAENPQLTSPGPATTTVTPTRLPTRAWVEEDGIAQRHVTTFQTAAPATPAATMPSAVVGARSDRFTKPPTVSATAVPARKGPTSVITAKKVRAPAGRIARVTTPGAVISAASWKPLVTLKTTAASIAIRSRPVSTSATPRCGASRARIGIAAHRAPFVTCAASGPGSPGRPPPSSERPR